MANSIKYDAGAFIKYLNDNWGGGWSQARGPIYLGNAENTDLLLTEQGGSIVGVKRSDPNSVNPHQAWVVVSKGTDYAIVNVGSKTRIVAQQPAGQPPFNEGPAHPDKDPKSTDAAGLWALNDQGTNYKFRNRKFTNNTQNPPIPYTLDLVNGSGGYGTAVIKLESVAKTQVWNVTGLDPK